MTIRAHGTRAKYVHEHCRCEPCTLANRRYARENQRATSRFRLRHVGGDWWLVLERATGAELGRSRDRAEAHALMTELNAELDYGQPLWASRGMVAGVRHHLRKLRAAGIGLRRVAAVTGIGYTRLGEIARNRSYNKARPRHRKMRATTAEKILGVRVDQLAAGAIVDAGETWRLIDELRAAGTAKRRIAAAMLGHAVQGLQLRRDRILKRSADRIRELHDRFFENQPQLREHCDCRERQKAAA